MKNRIILYIRFAMQNIQITADIYTNNNYNDLITECYIYYCI